MSDKYWFDEPQSMTGYGNIKLGTKTVNSRDAVDVMNKLTEQIKLLREALLLAQLYAPANLIDSEVVREALEATKE